MTSGARFVPEDWPRVVPRIFVRDARGLVEFLRRVFDATGEHQDERPSEIRIGDSVLLVSDFAPRVPTTAFLYVYVADADATWRRALDAGARSVESPSDQPYGDRRATVEDAWGNTWQIATHRSGA